jgi:hypothetical protein
MRSAQDQRAESVLSKFSRPRLASSLPGIGDAGEGPGCPSLLPGPFTRAKIKPRTRRWVSHLVWVEAPHVEGASDSLSRLCGPVDGRSHRPPPKRKSPARGGAEDVVVGIGHRQGAIAHRNAIPLFQPRLRPLPSHVAERSPRRRRVESPHDHPCTARRLLLGARDERPPCGS